MKKTLILTAVIFAFSASTALAEQNLVGSRDLDGDGKITKGEYLISAEKRFLALDMNSDGILTQKELQAHRANSKKKAKEKVRKQKIKDQMVEPVVEEKQE